MSEYDSLQYSKALSFAAIDLVDEGKTETRDKKFGVSAVVEGAPIKLSASDAKSLSQYSSKHSSRTLSEDEKLSYLKIALSTTGSSAYKACLANEIKPAIRVEFPNSALTAPMFRAKIGWHPTKPVTKIPADMEVTVINGSIKRASSAILPINTNSTISVTFERDVTKPTTISVDVDNESEVYYLPPIEKPTVKLVELSKSVAIGSWNGNGASKKEKLCLTPSNPNNLLLASSAVVTNVQQTAAHAPIGHHTRYSQPVPEGGNVCMEVSSDGIGADTHDWKISVTLMGYEAQPLK